MMDYAVARRHMIDSQILPNKVTDPAIIDALATVPRELFVPEERRTLAYCDEAIGVGAERYLMEPMIVGRLLQSTEVTDTDLALCVGAGTGYLPAVLSRVVETVVVAEPDSALRDTAAANLGELGIDNVAIMEGSLQEGYPEQAPYDVILFDGAVPSVPTAIAQQLGEGGRLAVIVGGEQPGQLGRAMITTRFHGALSTRHLFDAGTPMLPGFEAPPSFRF